VSKKSSSDSSAGRRAQEKIDRDEKILKEAGAKKSAEDRQNALIEQLRKDTLKRD
jgi:hypothetical protein